MVVDPPQFHPSRRREQEFAEVAVSRDLSSYGIVRADSFIGEAVDIHLYDLSDTLAHVNSVALDFLGFGAALHVGLEVVGEEWSFGMHGVTVTIPKRHQYYAYRRTVHLGRTYLKRWQVEEVLSSIQDEWRGSDYDIFSHNCGHFCNSLALQLGVRSVPPWVTSLAEAMGRLPGGRTLAEAIARATVADDVTSEPGASFEDEMDESQPQAAPLSPVRLRMGHTDCVETTEGAGLGLLRSRRCEAFRESQVSDRREAVEFGHEYARKEAQTRLHVQRRASGVLSMAARGGA